MKKQVRLKDIQFSASVPKSVFDEAFKLSQEERFFEAKEMIEESWSSSMADIGSNHVSGGRLFSLYADILYFLKEHEKLVDFLPAWEELENLPQ